MCSAEAHVRFTPESGHVRCNSPCPLWAKSGHAATTPETRVRRGAESRWSPCNHLRLAFFFGVSIPSQDSAPNRARCRVTTVCALAQVHSEDEVRQSP